MSQGSKQGAHDVQDGDDCDSRVLMRTSLDPDHLLAHLPRLRRYARALTGSRDDADDLVQDTLERAWRKSDLWHGVDDMRAWLFAIMHNLYVQERRRPRLNLVQCEVPPDAPVAPAHDGRLSVRDLQTALAQLPREQRAIVLLVALEDVAYADVARLLDIPIGTVMSRLSRGRERLRTLMEAPAQPVRLHAVQSS